MTITGELPSVYRQPGDLPDDAVTQQLLAEYATGTLMLNVKRFASCRNFLFKQIKEVRS
jgi:hypothetical protein